MNDRKDGDPMTTETMIDGMTLEEALLGGPGLDGYAFSADVYCEVCGQELTRLAFKAKADELPMPIFFGESDRAEHCAACGEYLYGGEV